MFGFTLLSRFCRFGRVGIHFGVTVTLAGAAQPLVRQAGTTPLSDSDFSDAFKAHVKAVNTQAGENIVTKSDQTASDLLESFSKFKGGFATLGKVAGVAGGVMALGEDIIGGKIAGDNADEKEGNELTIASTVMDFIPMYSLCEYQYH
eukprot:COSAG02_NODE_7795_length_2842_cov_3.231498_2_plen_148_part_00